MDINTPYSVSKIIYDRHSTLEEIWNSLPIINIKLEMIKKHILESLEMGKFNTVIRSWSKHNYQYQENKYQLKGTTFPLYVNGEIIVICYPRCQ